MVTESELSVQKLHIEAVRGSCRRSLFTQNLDNRQGWWSRLGTGTGVHDQIYPGEAVRSCIHRKRRARCKNQINYRQNLIGRGMAGTVYALSIGCMCLQTSVRVKVSAHCRRSGESRVVELSLSRSAEGIILKSPRRKTRGVSN